MNHKLSAAAVALLGVLGPFRGRQQMKYDLRTEELKIFPELKTFPREKCKSLPPKPAHCPRNSLHLL